MSDGQEGHARWFLRYVFVPLAVVVVGAGATYYFSHRDDAPARGTDSTTVNSAAGLGGQDALQPGPDGTVPPPPGTGDNPTSRTADGGVRVEPPPSMGNRD